MTKSYRARLISFVAMWSVVAWHCYCGSRIEKWFIPLFCYWSVPWFFLVSGFFFPDSFAKKGVLGFAISKLKSLCVPYVLWSMIGFLVFLSCSIGPVDCGFRLIFALGGSFSPAYNPPLWYIRALLIFSVIGGGALWMMCMIGIRNDCVKAAGFCFLFFMLYSFLVAVGIKVGPGSSPVYFLLGVILYFLSKSQKFKWALNWAEAHALILGLTALIVAIMLRSIWFSGGHSFSSTDQGGVIIGNLSSLALIIALWQLTGKMTFPVGRFLWYVGAGVFVYLMHRPLLMCLVGRVTRCMCDCDFNKDVLFGLLVVLYTPLCLLTGRCFYVLFPRAYSVLIGGR